MPGTAFMHHSCDNKGAGSDDDFKEILLEDLDVELQEFVDSYCLQAKLLEDDFFREFEMYLPNGLDDDVTDVCGMHGIFDDFIILMNIGENRPPEKESAIAVSIIKRCNVILENVRHAVENNETLGFTEDYRKVLCLASVIQARSLLQKLSEKELTRAMKSLDVGILYGTPTSDCNPFCAINLVNDKLDEIRVVPHDTRTLLRCDGLKGDDIDTDDDERGPRLNLFQSMSQPDDIICEDCPSLEVFLTKYFLKNEPVKLQSCMNCWPAMIKWKYLSYLNRIAGLRTVPIEMGDYSRGGTSRLVTLGDYLEELHVGSPVEKCGYLAQHRLTDQEPRLRSDIVVPDYCAVGDSDDVCVNIWLGPAQTFSSLHYDRPHNILSQVLGRKMITLYSQQDGEYLYPRNGQFFNTSAVDIKNPDLEAFPEFPKATPLVCVLEPGDQLFIPSGWWHAVESLDVSLSVNFFF